MTSTTDTAGHPDVTEISDLTEGLLPPSRSTDLRRHLEACELCADVHASLEEIRGLLGTLPGPPRMPAEIAGRIDAALAAEALLNASAPEDSRELTASDETEEPESQASPVDSPAGSPVAKDGSARVSRETSKASPTADRPAGRARSSSTGPGRKERTRGNRRRTAVLGAVLSAAALGLGGVLWTSLTGTPSGTSAQDQVATAADTFSEGRLETQVADLLADKESPRSGSRAPEWGVESAPNSASPRTFRQQPTVDVPACVQQGIGRDEAALATEQGIFQGTKALLVVLPDASDSSRVTAYIVDSTCVGQASPAKAKVLLEHSYTRS
ncbi:hypothetical protein ACWC10_12795 [Streptomyces sp. NPDC001595]|uniref:hypothetical protein n=1 Tax=Streptomyces sp. NPDC001532 TaxID=3154520 RepID=UPI0033280257